MKHLIFSLLKQLFDQSSCPFQTTVKEHGKTCWCHDNSSALLHASEEDVSFAALYSKETAFHHLEGWNIGCGRQRSEFHGSHSASLRKYRGVSFDFACMYLQRLIPQQKLSILFKCWEESGPADIQLWLSSLSLFLLMQADIQTEPYHLCYSGWRPKVGFCYQVLPSSVSAC